jgi:heme-degrading monooxygenase HmoA
MILTQLEGRVSEVQWDELKKAFDRASQELPPAILHSYLLQEETEKEVWRVVTIWQSRQALEAYRASVETPGGVLMFRAAGTEPTLFVYEVVKDAHSI